MIIDSTVFSLPHTRLAGLTNNRTDKPPLLALHGWLDNAGSFEQMIPFWQDFNVVAIDFPGHGLSNMRSDDAHYHFVDWVYDVHQLIEHLGWQEFYLVGHSMGAMVGSVFSATFPEKVRKLFMIDSIGLITTDESQTTEQLRKSVQFRANFAKRYANTVRKGSYKDFDTAISARVHAGGVSNKEAQILAKRGVVAVDNGYIWRSDGRLRAPSALRLSIKQAGNFISNIQCPVKMVAGDEGSDLVNQLREHFEPLFANIDITTMPGGHHCHMTHPKIAADLAREFFIEE